MKVVVKKNRELGRYPSRSAPVVLELFAGAGGKVCRGLSVAGDAREFSLHPPLSVHPIRFLVPNRFVWNNSLVPIGRLGARLIRHASFWSGSAQCFRSWNAPLNAPLESEPPSNLEKLYRCQNLFRAEPCGSGVLGEYLSTRTRLLGSAHSSHPKEA